MSLVLSNGNLVECNVIASCVGQVSNTKLVFVVSDVVGTPTLRDLVDLLDTNMNSDFGPLLAGPAFYRGTLARKIFPVTVPAPVTLSASTPVAGGGGTVPMPTQTTGLVRWVTDTRVTGRSYVPFPSTDFGDATASPLVAYLNLLDTWANNLTPDIIVTGLLGSCTIGLGVNSGPYGFTRITGHVSEDGWATQTRRSQFRHGDRLPF